MTDRGVEAAQNPKAPSETMQDAPHRGFVRSAGGPTVSTAPLGFERAEARGVTKIFGRQRALHRVDLSIEAGTVTGLLGPNGAGKTTLLSLFSTLSRPTQGTLHFGALPPGRAREARGHIGLVSHAPLTYGDLSALENVAFFARMYGSVAPEREARALLEAFGLGDAADRLAKTFSRGMRQRLGLARALVGRPSLVLLDEPFTGLDRASRDGVVERVGVLRSQGAIVLMVSHDLGTTAYLADRVAVLRRGRVAGLHEGRLDPDALRRFYAEAAEGDAPRGRPPGERAPPAELSRAELVPAGEGRPSAEPADLKTGLPTEGGPGPADSASSEAGAGPGGTSSADAAGSEVVVRTGGTGSADSAGSEAGARPGGTSSADAAGSEAGARKPGGTSSADRHEMKPSSARSDGSSPAERRASSPAAEPTDSPTAGNPGNPGKNGTGSLASVSEPSVEAPRDPRAGAGRSAPPVAHVLNGSSSTSALKDLRPEGAATAAGRPRERVWEVLVDAWRVAEKDLRVELRSREILLTMGYFGFLVVLIFAFAFSGGRSVPMPPLTAGILWVTVALSGTLGLGRAFEREREGDCLRALLLAPISRAAIYLGKTAGVLVFMVAVEAVVLPAVLFFFNLRPSVDALGTVLLTLGLGTVGYAILGTLLAAMLSRARAKDVLLAVVFYPLVLPVLIVGVKATTAVLDPLEPLDALGTWLRLLFFFDLLFGLVALWIFEPLITD